MNKPILVTGAHLSGSTWIGKIIASAPGIKYIHEPFNVEITRYQYKSPLKYWFQHVSPGHDKKYEVEVKQYLQTFYKLRLSSFLKDLSQVHSVKKVASLLIDAKDKITKPRPLFKDPIALLSSEWIAKTMNADIIISVRHPAAFTASLKMKNWDFNFNNFVQQHQLTDTYLQPLKETIHEYALSKQDVISQGILLWNILYGVTKQYDLKYKDKWQIIRNEDLSLNPFEQFKSMFQKLDIKFNDKIASEIQKTTGGALYNKTSRDSKSNISTWKQRLTPEEIERIKEGTREVWPHFYSEENW